MEISKEELRQEVIEWTTLMRTDGAFASVRRVAEMKGLSLGDTLLAGFVHGEDDGMVGGFIVNDGQCIFFEIDPDGSLAEWEEVEDISSMEEYFYTIPVAIEMKMSGEILCLPE